MIRLTLSKLILFFNLLCILVPLGMAVIVATIYMCGGWGNIIQGHDLDYYSLPPVNNKLVSVLILFVLAVFCSLMIYLITKVSRRWFKYENMLCVFNAAVIFVLAGVIRISVIFVFREDIQPFSDFYRVWSMACGDTVDHIDYYSLFPAYMNFAIFERKLIQVFGDSFINIIYMNGIMASLTAMFCYIISRIIFENDKIAITAALLYVFMPSNIFYCVTGTPEFLVIMFNTLGVLFLTKAFKASGKLIYVYLVFGGLALGIGSSYKSFGIIIIIAFVMSFLAMNIMGESNVLKYSEVIKRCLIIMISIVLVMGGYKVVTTLIIHNTEKEFNMELDSSTALPHYFLIGLNTEGEGQISVGTISRLYYKEYLDNGFDVEAAKQYAEEVLKNDWSNNVGAIIPNLVKKMIWAWQDDNKPLAYFNTRVGIDPDTPLELWIYNFTTTYMGTVGQIYYWGLMLAAMICSILYCKQKKLNYGYEFQLLIIFGYFCLLIFSEAQSRYKCLIMPYICVIGAYGLYSVIAKMKNRGWKK